MKLEYELIDESNIELASAIQGVIFEGESALGHYQYAIASHYQDCMYYIIKWESLPVGITGMYLTNMYGEESINDDSVWLGWYGILPEFRSRGIGRQSLLDTMEMAKRYHRKFFRLYTSYQVHSLSKSLYESVMHTCEAYNNLKDYNYDGTCVIYSYSYTGEKVELWNHRYAYIREDMKLEEMSNQKLKDRYRILILLDESSNHFMETVQLATVFREDGHLVTLGTTLDKKDIVIKDNPLLNAKNIMDISTGKRTFQDILKDFKELVYQNIMNGGDI